MDVLLLGGGGGLGRLVRRELERRGHAVCVIGRATGHDVRDPDVLARAAAGCGAIVNCAGASVALRVGAGWRGYRAIDTRIGLAAVEAARRTAARLVYVGVHAPGVSAATGAAGPAMPTIAAAVAATSGRAAATSGRAVATSGRAVARRAAVSALARTPYVDAHERVARAMRAIDGVVIRATGFFSAYAALQPLARRGVLVDIGDGRARTNPIDERDLAEIVAESVVGDGPRALAAGGPEVLTRREIFERVAASVAAGDVDVRGARGRRPETGMTIHRVPAWLARAGGVMLSAVHPRLGQLTRFAALLATHDVIAPALGTRTLAAYLADARVAA